MIQRLFPFLLLLAVTMNTAAFDHSPLDHLLKIHVTDGWVDYKGFQKSRSDLQEYLNQLAAVTHSDFDTWPRREQMAYWINAYNAITIEGILRNYPIQYGNLLNRVRFPKNSIRQIGNFWNTVFVRLMGEEITLNQIEHQILRKQFGDPRIHFALVCASIGCPKLHSFAFNAAELESQLETAAREFITDSTRVRLDRIKNRLYLSSIFDWYKEDFRHTPEMEEQLKNFPHDYFGVVEFVCRYLPTADTEFVLRQKPALKFLDYNWSLNEK